MNERQLSDSLQEAADNLGLNLWALARRLDEPEHEVASAFSGGQKFTVELLVDVAHALGLEVQLHPASPTVRQVGPVPSVVDQVVQRLTPHLIASRSSAGFTPNADSTDFGPRARVDPSGGEK